MSEIKKKENTQNSIDSIDFNSKSQILNSPRSLLACKKLGINPSELYYISLEDYKNKNLENKNLPKDILDMKYEEFENYRNKSIEQVKEERNKIIEEEKKKEEQNKNNNEENKKNIEEKKGNKFINKTILIFIISIFVICITYLLSLRFYSTESINSCFFKANYKESKIKKLELNKSNEFEQFHNLKIYFDYTNIDISSISDKKKEKLKQIFEETSFLFSQLIISSNNNIIDLKNFDGNCSNYKIKYSNILNKDIKPDLIIFPIINQKKTFNKICSIDKNSKRAIVSILSLSNTLKETNIKTNIIHQLIHILGFNPLTYKLKPSNLNKILLNYYTENSTILNKKSFHWDKKLKFHDIMSNNYYNYLSISEHTLDSLSDNNYDIINKCALLGTIYGECTLINKKLCVFTNSSYLIYYNYDNNNKIFCYANTIIDDKNDVCSNKFSNLISETIDYSTNYDLTEIKQAQNLLLLVPSKKCPKKHPRTLFLYNNPDINIKKLNPKFKIENVLLTNKEYFIDYNRGRLTDCFAESGNYLFPMSNIYQTDNTETNFNYGNFSFSHASKIAKELNKYNIFTPFPVYHTSKTKFYLRFKEFKNKFPDDYNFMQESYIIPEDNEIIKKKFENYTLSIDNLWMKKPNSLDLGRGVEIITDFNNLPKKGVITKYITNPLLLYGKKTDMRIYAVVTSYYPLKIYMNMEGCVRKTAHNFTLDLNSIHDKFTHLTHLHVNKKDKENFKIVNDFDSEEGNYWTFKTFKNYIKKIGGDPELVFERIKDVIIKSIISLTENNIEISKKYNIIGKKVFQNYGYDILIDQNYRPWILEANSRCVDLSIHNKVDLFIKTEYLVSLINMLGIIPYSHNNYTSFDEIYNYTNTIEEIIDDSICEFERSEGSLQRIFPLKNNIDKYKKYFSDPGELNLKLWERLKDYE